MTEEFRALLMSERNARESFIQAMSHAKSMLDNGEHVLVTVGPALEPIGIQQRKFLHGVVLEQISEQVRVQGQRYTIDVWKEYFKKKFLKPTWKNYRLPGAKRATPHRVPASTERLGVKAYSKFIDNVIDHSVLELSVVFDFVAAERESVRYVAPARSRRADSTELKGNPQ